MCGRYSFTKADELGKRFGVNPKSFVINDNYNVSPAQTMPVIIEDEKGRQLMMAKWGIHREFKDFKKDIINTRADKAFSGFWSKSVKTRRCLVPATGFVEWDKVMVDDKQVKQPYFVHPKDLEFFAFAGIYEISHDDMGKEVVTYSIMTTEANKEMSAIHNRLPVMLHQDDESSWLSPSHDNDRSAIEALLRPWEDNGLELYELSRDVNNSRNNYPELLYPLNAQ